MVILKTIITATSVRYRPCPLTHDFEQCSFLPELKAFPKKKTGVLYAIGKSKLYAKYRQGNFSIASF